MAGEAFPRSPTPPEHHYLLPLRAWYSQRTPAHLPAHKTMSPQWMSKLRAEIPGGATLSPLCLEL